MFCVVIGYFVSEVVLIKHTPKELIRISFACEGK